MIELRLRTRSTGYIRVNTDEDFEEIASSPSNARRKFVPKEPPKTCAICCFFFSLSGIVFLSLLAVLLAYDSPYIVLNPPNRNRRTEFVDSVVIAVIMYLVCLLISAYFWCRTPYIPVVEDARFND